jgi:myosin heavy subunit
MLKNWFLLASVSCGVGFGSTFLISRNLQQSTLAGLGTVPAVAASLTILSRQRREEIDRQVAQSKQQLQLTNASCSEISAHWQRVQEQEQLFKDRCREISAHGKELQTEYKQLKQEVDRYRERQASLEREINSLVLQKQTRKSLLVQLDGEVLDKQKQLKTTQTELAQIQTQKESEIDSATQSNLKLQRIREEIRQDSAAKKQLDDQITDLGRLLQQKQSLLQNTDWQQQQLLQKGISDLLLQKQDQKVLFDELVVSISTKHNNLVKLDNEISERQANLDRIAIDLAKIESRKQSAINSAQRSELALTNIEDKVSERQANLDRIAIDLAEIESKRQSIIYSVNQSEFILADISKETSQHSANKQALEVAIFELQQQLKNSQLPTVSPDLIPPVILVTLGEWENFFEYDPNLPILKDIKTHGRISISEATRILGSDRLRRGFADKITKYNQDFNLPFNIKIENFNNTDYYIKIGKNETAIFDLKESQDAILIDREEPEEIQSNGLQDQSDNESRAWDYHFQNDPLLPILRCINSYSQVAKSTVNGMIRISSLTINFQAELPIYNSNENLPFLITEGVSHTGEEFYIKQLKYC